MMENGPIRPLSAVIVPVISAFLHLKYPVSPLIRRVSPLSLKDLRTLSLNMKPATFAPSANRVSVAIFTNFCIASQFESPLADVGAAVTEAP